MEANDMHHHNATRQPGMQSVPVVSTSQDKPFTDPVCGMNVHGTVSDSQKTRMADLVRAIETVIALPSYRQHVLADAPAMMWPRHSWRLASGSVEVAK